jgi:ribosomal protein L37AE/L43A
MIEKLFVLLNDITDKETGDIVERIGIESNEEYKTKPKKCPTCNKKSIAGLEIIGTHDSSLLWQCIKCGDRFLKLDREKTLELLETATSAWTNPNDWGETDKTLN